MWFPSQNLGIEDNMGTAQFPGDEMRPTDWVNMQMREGLTYETLPRIMQCPNGHISNKYVFDIPRDWEHEGALDMNIVKVPVYWCGGCMALFRYQECRLAPGDEGTP